MNFNDLSIQDYAAHFLKETNESYGFEGKNVMFLFYQPDIDNAKAVKCLGAKKVFYVNPDENTVSDDEDIICLNSQAESFPEIKDNSIDLIIGLEILEHINNLQKFFKGIKRIVKKDGNIELHGNPMWTSHYGHHLWIEGKYIFYEKTNPFEPWEHLVYKNKDEYFQALKNKGIPKEDIEQIISFIYDRKEISRHTPTEIIEAASDIKTDSCTKSNKANYSSSIVESCKNNGWDLLYKRYYDKTEPNKFFEKAKEFYDEDDLKTQRVVLKMQADTSNISACYDKYEMPVLPQYIEDVLNPFFKKHDMAGKKVLNLCYNNNELIAKAFIGKGAESVYSVSPFEKNNQDNGKIKIFQMNFEDVKINDFPKFDVIFFMDTLHNFKDFDKFLKNLKHVVKEDTIIYIMGYMPYSSPEGNLIYTDKHHFCDETSILEPWEHLAYETKEELEQALSAKNISDNEIKEISDIYFAPSQILKLSPSELWEKFSEVKKVYLNRIYKYFPKNKYYEIALKKYKKEDLDVERVIFTTDFPEKLNIEELNIDSYLQNNLIEMNRKYIFAGKRILNVTPYINDVSSDAIETLGAKEVVSLSKYYSGYELRGGDNIRRINQDFEDLDNLDEKFDIIYGLDVLEHVKDLRKFYANVIRLIDDKGVICIQGSPLWPSDNGHNFLYGFDCENPEAGNLLEPWEHLAYDTKEEMKDALIKKNFSVNDAEKVSDFIFNSDEINRLSFIDFLNVLDEFDNVFYGQRKFLHYAEENEFYKKANQKYTHEELRTKELKLFIRKKH